MAFDQLFDTALGRLHATCSAAERADARARFEQHFANVLEIARGVDVPGVPVEALAELRASVENLSPADLAGMMASVPIARQTQAMLRTIARRNAERRMVEHMASAADTRWGH